MLIIPRFSSSHVNWIILTSLIAVAAHKYVISFCVGLELYNVGTPKILYAAYTVTYAMMSVIGIGIGIGVTSAIEDNEKAYMTTVGVLSVSNIKSFLSNHKTFIHYYHTF